MRRYFVPAVALALLGVVKPVSAQWADFHAWSFCTANSLSVCTDFTILRDGASDAYRLRIGYTGSAAAAGEAGVLTSATLLRTAWSSNLAVSNVALFETSPDGLDWSVASNVGQGFFSPIVLEVLGIADGEANGLPLGGFVTISFNSRNLATYNTSYLYAAGTVRNLGSNECTLVFESHSGDNVVGGTRRADEVCGTAPFGDPSVVPEPITMVLLGSGLAGLGAVRLRRREPGAADPNAEA